MLQSRPPAWDKAFGGETMARNDLVNDLVAGCAFLGHLCDLIIDGTVEELEGVLRVTQTRMILAEIGEQVMKLDLTPEEVYVIQRANQRARDAGERLVRWSIHSHMAPLN